MVVGLGPAGPDLVAPATLAAAARVPARWLRTARHPSSEVLAGAASFDSLYESAATLDDVYRGIVDALVEAAVEHGEVLYAVPGSPAVAERSVELLRGDPRVVVEIVPALSFLDLAWARLGVDPVAAGVRVVDGRRFAVEAAGERGPLLVAQCDTRHVLSDVKLAVDPGPAGGVTVLQRLGLPGERIFQVGWDDLDRGIEPDHLTSLYVPELAAPVGAELVRFAELVRTLRERCPWDREQSHATLTRHLLEETYEVLDAVAGLGQAPDGTDPAYAHLEEELGDLLFQVYFHATLAAEAGAFTLADVARGIHDKLVRRHPHVFADVDAATAGEVMRNWEQIKKAEKGRASVMDGIPSALPALLYALKVQRKAANVGFDWPSVEGPYAKVAEELAELRADPGAAELGDLLFAVVNAARHLAVDPEAALRDAVGKFRARFGEVEALAAERGVDLAGAGIDVLDALWDEVKARPAAG